MMITLLPCGCTLFPGGSMRSACPTHEAAYRYREERDVAQTRTVAALRLHLPQLPDNDVCPTCRVEWPCETARVLGGDGCGVPVDSTEEAQK